jgi:hypothetical protein
MTMAGMNDAVRLKRTVRAAARLIDAIMRDSGGFSVEVLHRMTELGDVAGLPDHIGVTAATNWKMEAATDEPRCWGAGALADAESN